MKRLSLQFILLVYFIPGYALFAPQFKERVDEGEGVAKHVCRFVYPLGSAEIHSNLGNNAEALSQLDSFIRSAVTNSRMRIRRIRLAGYSSIEGSYLANERLAYGRVCNIRDYLNTNYPDLYRYPVDIIWVPEDWDGLSHLLRNSELPEKKEVLEIICKIRSSDTRESLLVKLNGGRAFWYMERYLFDQLRRVEIEIEYDTRQSLAPFKENDPLIYNVLEKKESDVSKNVPKEVNETPKADATQLPPSPPPPSMEKEDVEPIFKYKENRGETGKPLFAIKTNLLSWIGVLPDFKYTTPLANVALEYFVTPNWSVELGAAYSYWHYNHDQEFQGISGYRLEPHYHFSLSDDWLELYLGLYGRVGDYDINRIESDPETGLKQEKSTNYTGNYWDAGLSAGLTFKLGRGWAVEVGARMGYLTTNSILYTREGKYNWFKSRQPYDKIKVTDLNINLIYIFR
ncbi:MAG: DUF3575 domain-containing protein [Mediterranea sp.]|jgi:hypothetical protein|nr:DUF3575 domain-containing protein [Mediterranea sp.]